MAVSQSTKNAVSCSCAHCGKTFYTRPVDIRNGGGKYCGRLCYTLAKRTTPEEFWASLDRSGCCWLWTARINRGGYGSVKFASITNRDMWPAHRLAWTLANGPIPDGLLVLHDCDKNYPAGDITYRRCCNPVHLFLGTSADNSADMKAKGRQSRGERNSHAKLTPEEVVEIRRLYAAGGTTHKRLSRQFRITEGGVRFIICGRTWKHV